ncbi:type II CRISPR-associated endonuclease Cas1 [Microaceticoccus formicicus]|uniref:type II CRISPR-associated endonuclease Cas1 n=1 Tax=Microaceticoccus formicicus TaxID=3118105 RepID=UPI003CCFF653|nr:type II CRISPR-associated endonuclease Cas1 [Peptoniphilaceae bacterium AMB_02]
MTWRTVHITKRSKLDLRMNHLVVRSKDHTTRIHLSEVGLLMIETTQVSVTTALLSELSKQKIRVVICDEKHNPISELLPYHGCHDCSKKIITQFNWDDGFMKALWSNIIFQKIFNQRQVLIAKKCDKYYIDLLSSYLSDIALDDKTNREGLSAKVYFAGLFSNEFIRGDETVTNAALDYGYQIILSCFNREIKICGYLTELGIHHKSQHNPFNLSSDLMEPVRPIVDVIVYDNKFGAFGKEEKRIVQSVLHKDVFVNNKRQVLTNAISIYTKSIMDALLYKDLTKIKWIQYEL